MSGISWSDIGETTWSAVQASVSVILVLLYGYLARKYGLMSSEGEKNASKVSVSLFLPALLFSEIGPLASWDNLKNYWIIVVYSLFFQLTSYLFGILGVWLFKLPHWIVPCLIFNNATSLPLLLLSSLGDNGTLDSLVTEGEDLETILSRGKVYLLINALVCNLTRFSLGPYLLQPPKPDDEDDQEAETLKRKVSSAWAWQHHESPHVAFETQIHAQLTTALPAQNIPTNYPEIQPYAPESETQPLIYRAKVEGYRAKNILRVIWERVGYWLNPPLIGGLAAVFCGIIPFLNKQVFEDDTVLSPLTKSISNIGNLYTVLQMFVLGAHLQSKKGTKPPILPVIYLFLFRFGIMPVISTATIYGVRSLFDGKILDDPILDFTMALAPVGPPALTLAAIVEMAHLDSGTDTAVSQIIVLSYIFTPLISLSVTGILQVIKGLY